MVRGSKTKKENWSVLRLSQAIKKGRYEALPKTKDEQKTSPKLARPGEPAYLYIDGGLAD